jgi:hypothetical protein
MQSKKLYLWYSAKQRPHTGLLEYRLAEGKTVLATEISETPECPNEWDDTQFMGESFYPGGYVRRAQRGRYDLGVKFAALDAQDNFNHSLLEKERTKSADLLTALEIALPYVESFDGDNADLQTKANAEAVRAAIAKAKGEKS